ncbi:hypothetical protein WJX73_005570 [Symbiochloris irregularis]|uniref:Protein kinase domain-containing protein n=1 Tax=Symbiochloris irregularis TaxID=706552 RepID=A0AAW1NL45_9CHLO
MFAKMSTWATHRPASEDCKPRSSAIPTCSASEPSVRNLAGLPAVSLAETESFRRASLLPGIAVQLVSSDKTNRARIAHCAQKASSSLLGSLKDAHAQQDLHALHHDYTETLEQVAAYEDAHAGLLQDNASNVSEIQQLKQDQQLQAAQIRNVQGQLCIVQQDKARLEQENARSAATIAFRDTQNKQLEAARRQLSAMLTLQKAEFSAVDTLGEGGCGLVVRANHADRTIPHEFAIKCAQEDDSDASITTRGRDSLQNEVMVLQSLGRSEYIASMRAVLYLRVDMPVLGRPLGIAFDVCEGGDLFGVLAAHHNAV